MNKSDVIDLLEKIKKNQLSIEEGFQVIKDLPLKELKSLLL